MSEPLPLSLIVITRDAGHELAACLASAPFAAEAVVVDSGSRDDTVAVAQGAGARVIVHAFEGYGPQKNFAVAQARHDWVLCIDADERLTPELGNAIRGVFAASAPSGAAYAMARRNRFLGRWLAHGEGYPDWNVRLFDRRRARWSTDPVHEKVVADGPVMRLAGDLLHASAESIDAYIEKQNRYTTMQAEAMHAAGKEASGLRIAFSPAARFLRFYVVKLGFLDGAAGFAHIAIGAFASFLKYAKFVDPSRRARARSASMHVLVTGAAGFIGMHTAHALLARGARVTGVDNLDPYYDVALKEARVATLAGTAGFAFEHLDLAEAVPTAKLFRDGAFSHVVHLAAQPGVRHSLTHPEAYLRNNVTAFGHVLEGCRHARIAHLVYASSSSVYGTSHVLPFSEDQRVDQPVSLYAATKCANELMAYSYSHLFAMPVTGLRFFTVYGPWGRPDQAPMLFAKAILAGEPIKVFNEGRMERDFTYIDDIVEGVARTMLRPPVAQGGAAPAALFNIGNSEAVPLTRFIDELSRILGREAIRNNQPMQPGDMAATYASIDRLRAATGFTPRTPLSEGLSRFVAWYRDYYRV